MIEKFYLHGWQSTLNVLAEIFNAPATLIMVIKNDHLEVFISSDSEGNPYKAGDKELFEGSGLYCEKVINANERLLVPNALKDGRWKNNPDIKLGMISYLGFPLKWPNGDAFGTICVLDRKETTYSSPLIKLLEKFKDHVELDLILLTKEKEARKKNEALEAALSEIRTLQGIIPICGYCHDIRDDKGSWKKLMIYVSEHTDVQFSFGICPKCNPKVRFEAGLELE